MPVESEHPIVVAATSDIHGLLEGIEEVCRTRKVDILVIAGDIEPADLFTSKPYWFEHKFFPLIRKLKCEVVVIPGNHDFYLSAHYVSIRRNENKTIPENFHLLIDEEVSLTGIRFYGTPWVPLIDGRWCFEGTDSDIADYFSLIPEGVDVLITHSPPLIPHKAIDQSCEYTPENRRHFGSKSLTEAIKSKSPSAVLCGHIHSGDHTHLGITSKSGKPVHIWNVSRVNEQYLIGYKIKILEMTDGTISEPTR